MWATHASFMNVRASRSAFSAAASLPLPSCRSRRGGRAKYSSLSFSEILFCFDSFAVLSPALPPSLGNELNLSFLSEDSQLNTKTNMWPAEQLQGSLQLLRHPPPLPPLCASLQSNEALEPFHGLVVWVRWGKILLTARTHRILWGSTNRSDYLFFLSFGEWNTSGMNGVHSLWNNPSVR